MGLIPEKVIELPHAELTIDPVRYDPNEVTRRFLAVTNALMPRYKLAGELRAAGAGKMTRSGDEYTERRGGLHNVEAEIKALEKKYDFLRSIIYMKTAEIRHFMG